MVDLLSLMNWLLPLLYLVLLIDYGVTFFLRARAGVRNPWLLPVVAVHTLFFVLRAIRLGYPPLVSSYEVLSVLALSTAAVYCVVELASHERRTGIFVFLLVFLFQYTSSVFLAQSIGAPAGAGLGAQSGWGRLHIVPAVMAYTGFTISAVYGLLYLRARRNLKQHRFGVLFDRLPPLDLLEKMSWYALLFGFVFMTITMATGPFILREAGAAGGGSVWDLRVGAKIVIGSVAWLIYLVAILGRLVGKSPPSRASGIAVGGFFVIMVMLVISALFS